jgi:hypothetical protein
MKLETENVKETEASAELVRELMSDDARRGNWLILMHDYDEEAFMQIAFDVCQPSRPRVVAIVHSPWLPGREVLALRFR